MARMGTRHEGSGFSRRTTRPGPPAAASVAVTSVVARRDRAPGLRRGIAYDNRAVALDVPVHCQEQVAEPVGRRMYAGLAPATLVDRVALPSHTYTCGRAARLPVAGRANVGDVRPPHAPPPRPNGPGRTTV